MYAHIVAIFALENMKVTTLLLNQIHQNNMDLSRFTSAEQLRGAIQYSEMFGTVPQEMLDRLTLEYNRARQAAVTQELTEIVSGASLPINI